MNETLQIALQFEQTGNGQAVIKTMSDATAQLAKREEEYQKRLAGRVKSMEDAKRLQDDLTRMGLKPEALTGEQKYQETLKRTVEWLQQKKRLEEDLTRLGHRQADPMALPPMSGREKFEAKLAATRAQIEEREKINEHLEQSGHRKSKDQVKQEEQARQEKDHAQRSKDATWLAAASGRPAEAAITGLLGLGKAATLAIAGIYALKSGVETFANIANIEHSNLIAPGMKRDMMLRESNPITNWTVSQMNKFRGFSAQSEELANVYAPKRALFGAEAIESERTVRPWVQADMTAQKMAGYAGEHAAFVQKNFSQTYKRGTVAEEQVYERQERLRGPQIEKSKAYNEELSAKDQLTHARTATEQARNDLAIAQQRERAVMNRDITQKGSRGKDAIYGGILGGPISAIVGAVTGGGDTVHPLDQQRKSIDILQEKENVAQRTLVLQQRLAEENQKEGQHAQAVLNTKKAGVEVQKAELSLLQEREQRVVKSASTFGRMNRVEAHLAVNAAETARKHGLDALMPEDQQRYEAVDPEGFEKMARKRGEQMKKDLGFKVEREGDNVSVEEAQTATQKARAKIDIQVAWNEAELARQMAASFDGLPEKIQKLINLRNKVTADKILEAIFGANAAKQNQ